MSDFLEHIFQGMISEAEAERIAEKANQEGYDVGYQEGYYQAQVDEVEY
jgi:flagellar biosynthesis/type III secretory pathway protein FliH